MDQFLDIFTCGNEDTSLVPRLSGGESLGTRLVKTHGCDSVVKIYTQSPPPPPTHEDALHHKLTTDKIPRLLPMQTFDLLQFVMQSDIISIMCIFLDSFSAAKFLDYHWQGHG